MSTAYYVYKHPSTYEKWQNMTFEKCIEQKIFIGVRSAGSRHAMHFTWSINPFEFMWKYYNDFYWIIDEHEKTMHTEGFCHLLRNTSKVTYEGDFNE